MEVTKIKEFDRRITRLERDMKRVKELLEMSSPINPLEWNELNDLDKSILKFLYKKKFAGATTSEIAAGIGLQSAETSGRVIVWKRLKRILKVSKEKEGIPLVMKEGRKWKLNFDDFTFAFPVEKLHDF